MPLPSSWKKNLKKSNNVSGKTNNLQKKDSALWILPLCRMPFSYLSSWSASLSTTFHEISFTSGETPILFLFHFDSGRTDFFLLFFSCSGQVKAHLDEKISSKSHCWSGPEQSSELSLGMGTQTLWGERGCQLAEDTYSLYILAQQYTSLFFM